MKRTKVNSENISVMNKTKTLMEALHSVNLDALKHDRYIYLLFKLVRLFGPSGVLELALLYRLQGKLGFQNKKLVINCNGQRFKGPQKLKWLFGSDLLSTENNEGKSFVVYCSSPLFVVPDVVAYYVCQHKVALQKQFPDLLIPPFLEFPSATQIPFSSLLVKTELARMKRVAFGQTRKYSEKENEKQAAEPPRFSNIYQNIVDKELVTWLERKAEKYIRTRAEEQSRVQPSFYSKGETITSSKHGQFYSRNVPVAVLELCRQWGARVFLQVVAHHATTRILFENQNCANALVNEAGVFRPVALFRTQTDVSTLDQALYAFVEPVCLALQRAGCRNDFFPTLQLPGFAQVPFIHTVPFESAEVRHETGLFLAKLDVEDIPSQPFRTMHLGDAWPVRVPSTVVRELEERILYEHHRRAANPFRFNSSTLFFAASEEECPEEQNILEFTETMSYLSATVGLGAVLELACIKASYGRRNIPKEKVFVNVDSPLLGRGVFSLLDLFKLELLHCTEWHDGQTYVTIEKILAMVPELAAFVLKQRFVSEDETSSVGLPRHLRFPQVTRIPFRSVLAREFLLDRFFCKLTQEAHTQPAADLEHAEAVLALLEKDVVACYEKETGRSFVEDEKTSCMLQEFEDWED